MEFNYYQILGVSQTATDAEIKAAYKELAKKYHPDKHGNNKIFEEHFKKINVAYQTLSDKYKRINYDIKLRYRSTTTDSNPRPSQPTSSQNAQAKRPQARSSYQQKKATKPAANNKKLHLKVYLITIAGLITVIIAGLYLYKYMNRYTAEQEYNEGVELEAQGKYHFALQSYSAALGYDNHYSPALAKKALLRMKLWEDYSRAYHDLSAAIEYAEQPDANLYFQRAKCLLKLKKREDALADLNEASTINPAFDSVYYYKGELYCYIFKDYEAAITAYNLALSKNKNQPDAWFGKGISELELDRYEEAIKDISEAINLNDKEGRYYYYRGYTHLALKDTVPACSNWNSALDKGFKEAKASLDLVCK